LRPRAIVAIVTGACAAAVLVLTVRTSGRAGLPSNVISNVIGPASYPSGWRCYPTGARTWRALWRLSEFCLAERRVHDLLDAASFERAPDGRFESLGRVWALGEDAVYADAARDSLMIALSPWLSRGRPCDLLRAGGEVPTGQVRGWTFADYDVLVHATIVPAARGARYGLTLQVIPGGVYGCGARRRLADPRRPFLQ
jgi:hypothetical protein